jgi:hypothetical protein
MPSSAHAICHGLSLGPPQHAALSRACKIRKSVISKQRILLNSIALSVCAEKRETALIKVDQGARLCPDSVHHVALSWLVALDVRLLECERVAQNITDHMGSETIGNVFVKVDKGLVLSPNQKVCSVAHVNSLPEAERRRQRVPPWRYSIKSQLAPAVHASRKLPGADTHPEASEALGGLHANCGSCHNRSSGAIARLTRIREELGEVEGEG